jgi:predicted CXXCH cytochrome family protein
MTGKRARFIVVLLCFALAAACVPQHAKRQPRKKCLECHEELREKFLSGIVHSPVKEENCWACHLPHGLIGGTYLRKNQPDLCFPCHKELAADMEKTSVHKPVGDGRCDKCHEVHNGPFPGLLKAERQDSCFACHDRKTIMKANVHSPVETGCETCHDNHASGNPALLLKGKDETCFTCHETGTEVFIAAHSVCCATRPTVPTVPLF